MGGRLKMLKFIVCEDDAEELNIAVQTITKSMMKYADIEYKVEKFQRYNEKLEKIINAGYSEVYIIGHSMGGVIASYLASKYKQVKKLVLAAPAFHYLAFKGDKVDVLESIKKLPNLFKNYNPEEVLSRLFKVPAGYDGKSEISVDVYSWQCICHYRCETVIRWTGSELHEPGSWRPLLFDVVIQ